MSRSRKKILSSVLIALTFVLWSIAFLKINRQPLCFDNEFPAEARVAKVIDGDTIVLEGGEKLRYLGINAPEIKRWEGNQWLPQKQMFGEEAMSYNQKLVEGKKVKLEYDRRKRDDYKRILGYVWSDGVLINGELIRKGLALVDVRYPNRKHQKMFFDFQKEARDFHRGIWGKIEDHTFSEQQAFKLIGEIGVVQGTIIRVTNGRDKIYLHFGKHGEKDFTAIIYMDSLQSFPWESKDIDRSFSGRKVKIYGFVRNHGGPAVIISAPSQLDILN